MGLAAKRTQLILVVSAEGDQVRKCAISRQYRRLNIILQSASQANQSKQCSPRARQQSKQQRARLTHGLLRSRQHRAPEAAAPSTRGLQMQPPRELWFP
jgi:hypothetical protein